MKLSTAIEGYFVVRSLDLSPNTNQLYRWALGKMKDYLGDMDVEKISERDLMKFFDYMKNDYQPTRMSGSKKPLASRSLENIWTAMRSFFNWAETELELKNRPDKKVPRIRYKREIIVPFTEEEVTALIKACQRTKVAETHGRKVFSMPRETARRDTAIILMLLDTGLRVSELCRLNIEDVDIDSGEVHIKAWGTGQKTKSRTVVIGKRTRKTLWRYLTDRGDRKEAPLFVSRNGIERISSNGILQLTTSLGKKAGIKNCHPHRFRHTMALYWLRNGGDPFTLQRILGHSTLDMVNYYIELSGCDVRSAHNRAAPVDRLHM